MGLTTKGGTRIQLSKLSTMKKLLLQSASVLLTLFGKNRGHTLILNPQLLKMRMLRVKKTKNKASSATPDLAPQPNAEELYKGFTANEMEGIKKCLKR